MRKLVVVVAAVAALGLASCGADPDLANLGAGGGGATEQVTALDNVFGKGTDPEVRVDVGDTVHWTNLGHNDHDIVAVAKGAGFGVDAEQFRPGDEYKHTFDKPGVYEYFCSLHGTAEGGMRGRVLVGDVKAPPPLTTTTAAVNPTVTGNTVKVPADQPTIQKAVDAAEPGDLVLIAPGTYHEAVKVPDTKPYLTIRGEDRNTTVLDGRFELPNGFLVVKAKGVAIENMTAKNYTKNGFYWTGVDGYRGSYLTAIRNGDYGLYAFESVNGQFDNSYATGSPDAGFYIGGCQPCNALIRDVVSEWNGLGYSGTNSGGNLIIANSIWRYNRAGIVPNSGSYEPNAPEDDNTIVGNLVHDNNNGKTPAIDISITAMGNGILVAGGINNVIERNRVMRHDLGGIVVISYPENNDYFWKATGNKVRNNVVSDSGMADLGLWFDPAEKETGGNCFADNTFKTTAPTTLEKLAPCSGTGVGSPKDGAFDVVKLAVDTGKPKSVDYRKAQLPPVPDQVNMPGAKQAKARPAIDVPEKFDVSKATVPAPPS